MLSGGEFHSLRFSIQPIGKLSVLLVAGTKVPVVDLFPLFDERVFGMMLLLVANVLDHPLDVALGYGEDTISFLPFKRSLQHVGHQVGTAAF